MCDLASCYIMKHVCLAYLTEGLRPLFIRDRRSLEPFDAFKRLPGGPLHSVVALRVKHP